MLQDTLMSTVFLGVSPLVFFVSMAVGLGYAGLLYSKKQQAWNKYVNFSLAALRFVVVSFLVFVLLAPFIKLTNSTQEAPVVVLALDDSQSLSIVSDKKALDSFTANYKALAQKLIDAGYAIDWVQLSDYQATLDSPTPNFNHPYTDLNDLLTHVQARYENRNLASVVLASDGITNKGISPLYSTFQFPIQTVCLGDTVPKKDVNLKFVYHNKLAYLGNQFPIMAEIFHNGYKDKQVYVSLLQGTQVLQSKIVTLKSEGQGTSVDFLVLAKIKGKQQFTVQVSAFDDEFTKENNSRNIYIEVIDGREKILLLAPSPHPDIKAIRSTIEKNENYQFETCILGLNQQWKKEEKYDLVIFHQFPIQGNLGSEMLDFYKAQGVSVLYVVTPMTNVAELNRLNNSLQINPRGRSSDLVTAAFATDFSLFTYETDWKSALTKYPPVSVPFGDYKLVGQAQSVVFQRVGSVTTPKPLLVLNPLANPKTGLIIGEGWWAWRLNEAAEKQDFDAPAFDNLLLKSIQSLTTKEDKSRFRVYTPTDEYIESETVVFETQIYNSLYEQIYGQKIELVLTDQQQNKQSFSFVNNQGASAFPVRNLRKGVYQYTAMTTLDGKIETVSGQFTVKDIQLEALNTTADFALLRSLAWQSGGKSYQENQLDSLLAHLSDQKYPAILHATESFKDFIDLPWIFWLLMILISIEWAWRKYMGIY